MEAAGEIPLASDIRLYIVEDDPSMRGLMQDLLATVGETPVVCSCARDFLAAHDPSVAALMVLDVRLPDSSGLELLARLKESGATVAAIVITGYADVSTAVRALKLGAVDFVEKPFAPQDLLDRVQRARDLLGQTWQARQLKAEINVRLASLTPRELEVLDLIVASQPNKLIADTLHLSQKTVEFHRAHLMEKMQAESVVDLVRQFFIARGF
jgi:FixJ family two-component response regulator